MEFNSRVDLFFVVGGEAMMKSSRHAEDEEERMTSVSQSVDHVSSYLFESNRMVADW